MSDTEARDQLADLIEWAETDTYATSQPDGMARTTILADAILAAGFRPPARTVTTVEELDALPDRSVIVAADCAILQCVGSGQPDWDGNVWQDEESRWLGSTDIDLPATVIYEPKEDQ